MTSIPQEHIEKIANAFGTGPDQTYEDVLEYAVTELGYVPPDRLEQEMTK